MDQQDNLLSFLKARCRVAIGRHHAGLGCFETLDQHGPAAGYLCGDVPWICFRWNIPPIRAPMGALSAVGSLPGGSALRSAAPCYPPSARAPLSEPLSNRAASFFFCSCAQSQLNSRALVWPMCFVFPPTAVDCLSTCTQYLHYCVGIALGRLTSFYCSRVFGSLLVSEYRGAHCLPVSACPLPGPLAVSLQWPLQRHPPVGLSCHFRRASPSY
ncbi:hypothetical protein B0T17DRAFT_149785 [Bombardia bombarda]|uniref:Uncharacterized protein n=1 Tax=Bombardia bombarda TaxID=252184 RepID=A0AA39X6Y0_9PEZI|nr:hypothetical protein B0T17DRAFT_149785 [Bombardia bombarda]